MNWLMWSVGLAEGWGRERPGGEPVGAGAVGGATVDFWETAG